MVAVTAAALALAGVAAEAVTAAGSAAAPRRLRRAGKERGRGEHRRGYVVLVGLVLGLLQHPGEEAIVALALFLSLSHEDPVLAAACFPFGDFPFQPRRGKLGGLPAAASLQDLVLASAPLLAAAAAALRRIPQRLVRPRPAAARAHSSAGLAPASVRDHVLVAEEEEEEGRGSAQGRPDHEDRAELHDPPFVAEAQEEEDREDRPRYRRDELEDVLVRRGLRSLILGDGVREDGLEPGVP
mmetsp:Transcript_11714/g.28868  ORF Transcript_11714/g.28868 Transcript_11714/m.28868 type:complete len:241 (-) Transcript_11714:452-1174(-)